MYVSGHTQRIKDGQCMGNWVEVILVLSFTLLFTCFLLLYSRYKSLLKEMDSLRLEQSKLSFRLYIMEKRQSLGTERRIV